LEEIFAVNVIYLELRIFGWPQVLFFGIELFERVKAVRTVIVAAFVHNDIKADLPAEEGPVAMGAVIFGLECFFITIVDAESGCADLTTQL
jgi:hypothetical protein